MDLILD